MTGNELARYKAFDGKELVLTADEVRRQFCSQATDNELALFAAQAEMFNANPWAREIYLVKYKDSPASVILSYHVFNRMATTQKDYDGIESGVIVYNSKTGKVEHNSGSAYFTQAGQQLVGGWAKVYKKGVTHPFTVTVNLQDFDKGTANWKSMKAFMIEKVAKAQAWRLAYPSLFANVYESSEIAKPTATVEEAPNTDGDIVEIIDGEVVDMSEEPDPVSMDAKQALWTACKAYAEATGADPVEISKSVMIRSDYDETDEFYHSAAEELQNAADQIKEA